MGRSCVVGGGNGERAATRLDGHDSEGVEALTPTSIRLQKGHSTRRANDLQQIGVRSVPISEADRHTLNVRLKDMESNSIPISLRLEGESWIWIRQERDDGRQESHFHSFSDRIRGW